MLSRAPGRAFAVVSQRSLPESATPGAVGSAWRRRWHRETRGGGLLRAPGLWAVTTFPTQTVRGKKTKTTVKLSDLPQGAIPLDPLPEPSTAEEDDGQGGRGGGPAYPTVVLQARQNMQKFDNCVLLTRVGGFYELYFEHAEEYGPLLNLKVAQKKTNAGMVPMAGFPFFQLERFLKILVQDLSRYVAIAEEYPNDASEKIKSGGLMHDRRVARVITPGTLIDENFMDPYSNNYVMAIHVGQLEENQKPKQQQQQLENDQSTDEGGGGVGSVGSGPDMLPDVPAHPKVEVAEMPASLRMEPLPLGLAWLDLSTGHFFTQSTDLASLSSILSRVCPREVILDRDLQTQQDHTIFSIVAEDRHLITYAPRENRLELSEWTPMLETEIPADARDAFSEGEVTAGSLLLNYIKDRLQGLSMKLQPPQRYENMNIMSIDKNSLRALEIKQTIRDSHFRGSLLHTIRRTVTKSGARLLNEWLSTPSTSLDVIRARQDLVAKFIEDVELREGIIVLLRRSHDSQRLVQKFALGRGDSDDLVALANTIRATGDIVRMLEERADSGDGSTSGDCLASMAARIYLDDPIKLARRIKNAIDEEGITYRHEMEEDQAGQMMALAQEVVSSEGANEDASSLPKAKKKKPTSIREYYGEDNEAWIMKPDASKALAKLHASLAGLLDEKVALEEGLRERYGAQSLTLKWSPQLGHVCHVKGKDSRNLTEIESISSSRSTRSFPLTEWTHLGQRLDQTRFHIRAEEQRVFFALREKVVLNLVRLRRNAAVLDELDIATSFASLAAEQNLVRPVLNNSTAHTIMGGRHPTVEGGLNEQGRSFTRNDCLVGTPSHGRLWLITGPNMAGKSTFLRQNALITILAQVGCYVPASFAELGIVDAIFSRVGSADNLYRDQSTFMVEMLETAQILRGATPRSFVIMDEIGRGTTPEDGAAVAFAALHHLVTVNQCRTLFATHFHAVADLAHKTGFCSPDYGDKGPAVDMYCTDVAEDGQGGFVYVHKLRKGTNRKSHALKVARLAGLPEQAIGMAEQVLRGQNIDTGSPSSTTDTMSGVAATPKTVEVVG